MNIDFKKLKYNIWLYFVLFAIAMLVILWITQVTFLENYYVQQKEDELLSAGERLIEYFIDQDENSFSNEAFDIEDEYGFTIILTDMATIYYPSANADYVNQKYKYLISECKHKLTTNKLPSFCSTMALSDDTRENVLVFANIVELKSQDADEGLLIITASLTLIREAVSVVQSQLLFVTLIIIILAFFIALYISNKLSKPLAKMNDTAKQLAKGDYSVVFEQSGYSEVAELAETLNYMKTELAKSGVLQRDLLANITHDLKTPLTMIKAYAEMIKDLSGDIKEKREKHANVIITEADRLTMLVNDILNLSKLQTSVEGVVTERVNLSVLSGNVVSQFEYFTEKEGYTLTADIDEELYSRVDAKKIEQVIYNLVGNAINYTGDDKTVELRLKRHGDNTALLEIIDSGKGIDEENIKTIWDKYYRASATHKRPVKGTGLGLSIVKAILESHNLRYGVVSKQNVGSNFFVEFNLDGQEISEN